jgi:hypothetical protein
MSERLRNIFDLKVHGISAGAIFLFHVIDLKTAAELFLICLNAAYIICRWNREARRDKGSTEGDDLP